VFAVNADKATELHRTGQAIGAVTFEDGVLKAVFYDYVVAKAHGGKDLVHDVLNHSLLKTLGFTLEELKQQFTCFAADGQYFAVYFCRAFSCSLVGQRFFHFAFSRYGYMQVLVAV
jgi:hypothetical protein